MNHTAVALRQFSWTALLLIVVASGGCGTLKYSDRVLADGLAASTTLAAYYDGLAAITLDGWQNQGVYNALLGVPAPSGEQYNERLQDFRQRADVAHAVVLVYQRLQALRDPKGLSGVTSAAQDLGTAVKKITVIPGLTSVPAEQVGNAAAALVNIQRERDLKRALTAIGQVHKSLAAMFAAEERVYRSVETDRTQTGADLVALLAQKKLANPGALLSGLHLGVTVSSTSDAPGAAAGLAILRVNAERTALAWTCATQYTAQILNALAQSDDAIKSGTPPSLTSLEQATTHANTCLKEHDTLVGSKQ